MPSHKSEDYKTTAVKYHLENDNELNKSVETAIGKINSEDYKNYFNYAFDKSQFKIPSNHSTRRRTLKKYKKVKT